MGWFDDQIKERKILDSEVFSDSFIQMAGAVMGSRTYAMLNNDRIKTKNAIDEILKFYRIKTAEIPDGINDVNEQLEYLLRPHGIMRRTVELEKGWYKDAIGALLTVRKDSGSVVALIPSGISDYSYLDDDSGKRIKINRKNEDLFEREAIAFYKPFPLKKLDIADLAAYMTGVISASDIVNLVASMLLVTFIGKLLPKINNILFGNVIDSGSRPLLATTAVFLLCVTLSSMLFGAVKTLLSSRINTKLDISVESATMMRVLSLPASFFKKYSSGELSNRVGCMRSLCEMLVSSVLNVGLTSLLSLVYLSSIFDYAPSLVIPSLLILLVTTIFSIVSTIVKMKITRKRMEVSAKESGMSYAIISGVQKIKLSGAEKRAFARWGDIFAKEAQLTYNTGNFIKANSAIALAISLAGTIILYAEAIENGVTMADYCAFLSAYGMIASAFSGLTDMVQNFAQIKPTLEIVRPIMEEVPEVSEGKQVITRLSGGIEISNLSFRYEEAGPNIIDDLSIKIHPGEYLAIVGKTGCGKSTLMRLMLGFETPQSGAIYYDGKDLNTIDPKSLRRKIGVVMQDGKLFQGDVFSNITISAPWLTLDDAWRAAEMAGIADDIRRMPMNMYTLISEGSGGISGGQRQRMMIARAVAPNPKILMFDEATSALDNITQKKVSESLDGLKCTRIVIAHRLSTIKHCDRIICLDKGRIIEDGTYDELVEKGGFFAELVERQRINSAE